MQVKATIEPDPEEVMSLGGCITHANVYVCVHVKYVCLHVCILMYTYSFLCIYIYMYANTNIELICVSLCVCGWGRSDERGMGTKAKCVLTCIHACIDHLLPNSKR